MALPQLAGAYYCTEAMDSSDTLYLLPEIGMGESATFPPTSVVGAVTASYGS